MLKNKDLQQDLKTLAPLAEESRKYISMPDVENLAEKLNAAGEKHQSTVLVKYAAQLHTAAMSYDVEQITRLLEKYPLKNVE